MFGVGCLAACGNVERSPDASPDAATADAAAAEVAPPPMASPASDAGTVDAAGATTCAPSLPQANAPCVGKLHCTYACGVTAHCVAGAWQVDVTDQICPFDCGPNLCLENEICLELDSPRCVRGDEVERSCPNADCTGRRCFCRG